ncbi:molybdenum cofactor guanylyltransferase [Gordonia humi]|uniref:Probable molybdenum cofactor guanylyltransferase n=1 Tax=Gordonia humi TaxID=686429 RepID=A0A840EWM7_9ACTN|nr:molybdenum cofactor guanylyltransferase [Gordonia humi]MBB4135991.1 molybdopterin-guanine dinucleotide biosynthesis protein A [Gordonia humi]
MSYDTVAGIILAGGRSRRMGQDKAGLEFEGVTMLTRVAGVVEQRCAPVLVAAPETSQAYRELSRESDLRWVTDEKQGSGPLGGLAAALAAAGAAGADVAFVCATDMPLIGTGLIEELLAGLTEQADAVIARDAQRDHPMAGVYRTRVAETLQALVDGGELRMTAAVEALDTRRVSVTDENWLTNVDAPEDLHRLRVGSVS